MRFALLLTAAAFVVAPAISQPLHTEHFDYRAGDFPADQDLENRSGEEGVLSMTGSNPTHTDYRASSRNSTIVEHGLGSRDATDLRTGENATSYTAFNLDLGSTSTGNAGIEDQQHGTGGYEAMGFVQSQGTTPIEQSNASAARLGWGVYFVLTMAVIFLILSALR